MPRLVFSSRLPKLCSCLMTSRARHILALDLDSARQTDALLRGRQKYQSKRESPLPCVIIEGSCNVCGKRPTHRMGVVRDKERWDRRRAFMCMSALRNLTGVMFAA
eukprot:3623542-Rhodomonas_salina.1